MALIRMTARKLAANRANARLSHGPITPAGKEKVSRSACKHHLYARKHKIPPSWEERILEIILPLVAGIDDPIERQIKTELAYYGQWSLLLNRFFEARLRAHIARCGGDSLRGHATFAAHDPLFRQIVRRFLWLDVRIGRAQRALIRHRAHPVQADHSHISFIPNTRLRPTAPQLHPTSCSAPAPAQSRACRPRRTRDA